MSGLYNLKKGVAVGSDLSSVAADDITPNYQVLADDGAITIPDGGVKTVFLTKGTASAITVAAPTATTHDGVIIHVVSTTAAAHTITATTIGFNAGDAASDVATLGAAKGNGLSFVAYQGEWYVLPGGNTNATLA